MKTPRKNRSLPEPVKKKEARDQLLPDSLTPETLPSS